ncbi:hypothetical protein ACFXPY_01755 [Streptomyces sp. NPDC059153]|uniref:hypothetical protein n=1 Tax=Streptomyces sp. NPDC059153 TaxID=3346743 RepID=UPI00369946CD
MMGFVLVMDEFGRIVAPGGADVVIVGMAGHSFTGNLTSKSGSNCAEPPRRI